ncbi:MAG: hypothetical protein ACREUT_04650, partial [Steroidobacteraceae bacterium]
RGVGNESPAAFATAFKQYFGILPPNYVRLSRAAAPRADGSIPGQRAEPECDDEQMRHDEWPEQPAIGVNHRMAAQQECRNGECATDARGSGVIMAA